VTTLIALFANPLFRKVALVIAIAAALYGVYRHAESVGRTQGEASASQRSADALEKTLAADRQQTTAVLQEWTAKVQDSLKEARTERQTFLALAVQRQQASAQVQGMTPEQVQALIEHYSPRDLADCVTQRPLLQKQIDSDEKVIATGKEVIAAQSAKYDSLAAYTSRVENNYVDLWNQKATSKRSPKCLYLWKCARPKLTAPDPKDLITGEK
jgi:type III secretory pathway component EscV